VLSGVWLLFGFVGVWLVLLNVDVEGVVLYGLLG